MGMKKTLVIFLLSITFLVSGASFVEGTPCASCDTNAECGSGERCIGGDPSTTPKKEGVCQPQDQVIFCSPITHRTFGELIDAIINFIFTIAAIVVPLLIIIGAFNIVTAAGDAKKIAAGKSIITYALIGFAVILLAKGLIAMLEQVIGIKIGSP